MKSAVSERAYEYFQSGLNCAESVLRSVLESVDGKHGKDFCRLATPFGGGVGGSRQELCGALAGGVMAIGFVAGRKDADGDAAFSKSIAAILRDRFIEHTELTRCQHLLDKFGPQEHSEQCAYLVAQAAGWVIELLEQHDLL